MDVNGTTITSLNSDPFSVSSIASMEILFSETIVLTDPNPPVITGVHLSFIEENASKNADDQYVVNPGKTVKVIFSAQDLDNDPITYSANVSQGEATIVGDLGNVQYKFPNESDIVTLTLVAQSKSRTATKNIEFFINAAPSITKITAEQLSKAEPLNVKAGNLVNIETSITDDIDNKEDLTIKWFSSIQGEIGNSSKLARFLSPGEHMISLEVVDSLGLKTHNNYFVNVEPLDLIWLKEPGAGLLKTYFDSSSGKALKETYEIDLQSDLNLEYLSEDENVVTVDASGSLQAVNPGTTFIKISSIETDANSKPIYEYKIVVRVIGKISATNLSLSPGQIKQIRVNKKTTINLTGLVEGNYQLKFFDEKETVVDSLTKIELKVNSSIIKTTSTLPPILIEVLDRSDVYQLDLSPHQNNHDQYIKIGLFPALDTIDSDSSFVNKVAWDGKNLEPNDFFALAYENKIGEAISSELGAEVTDKTDWYVIDIKKDGNYQLTFEGLSSHYWADDNYVYVYNSAKEEIASVIDLNLDKSINISFNAESTGKHYIKVTTSASQSKYRMKINPSIENGLVQDVNLEPNNFDFQATPIELSTSISSKIGAIFNPLDKKDWYVIEIHETGNYSVEFNRINSGDNTIMTLSVFDFNSQFLKQKQTRWLVPQMSMDFEALATGKYLVALEVTGSNSGRYSLKIIPKTIN